MMDSLINVLEAPSAGAIIVVIVTHVLARIDRNRKSARVVGKLDANADLLDRVRVIVNGRYTELERRARLLEEYIGLRPGELPSDLQSEPDGKADATK